jgi:hypothetical protein
MADRYNYDEKGRYTGKSSDDPPGSPIIGSIIIFFIVIGLLSMCSRSGSNSPKVPDSNGISKSSSSNTEPTPKWTIPDEETTAPDRVTTVPDQATQQEPKTQNLEAVPQEVKETWTVPKEE